MEVYCKLVSSFFSKLINLKILNNANIYFTFFFILLEYIDNIMKLGNKILIYLSGCLLGIAYPNRGYIPLHLQDTVRNNIVQFLCSHHSIKANDDEDIYPYLR